MQIDPTVCGCDRYSSLSNLYRNKIVSAGCNCDTNVTDACCLDPVANDLIGYNGNTKQYGITYKFTKPLYGVGSEMELYACVKGTGNGNSAPAIVNGIVGYYGVGRYTYACDSYKFPMICDDTSSCSSARQESISSLIGSKSQFVDPWKSINNMHKYMNLGVFLLFVVFLMLIYVVFLMLIYVVSKEK
eukprot:337856_1